MTREGWVTEGSGANGPCHHVWRKEFKGDGINWGLGTRYRKCSECQAYQRYHEKPKPPRVEPYPPCKQLDFEAMKRDVEAVLRARGYRAVHVFIAVPESAATRRAEETGGKT